MGVVADRAGVTRALVYKHFANKHDLLVALYRREATGIDRAHPGRDRGRRPTASSPSCAPSSAPRWTSSTSTDPSSRRCARPAPTAPRGRTSAGATSGRSVYFAELAEQDFGIDGRTARSVMAVLFSGIRSLLSQMRSRPGVAQRQFLLDTYVEMTIGALTRLAEPGSDATRPDPRRRRRNPWPTPPERPVTVPSVVGPGRGSHA